MKVYIFKMYETEIGETTHFCIFKKDPSLSDVKETVFTVLSGFFKQRLEDDLSEQVYINALSVCDNIDDFRYLLDLNFGYYFYIYSEEVIDNE